MRRNEAEQSKINKLKTRELKKKQKQHIQKQKEHTFKHIASDHQNKIGKFDIAQKIYKV